MTATALPDIETLIPHRDPIRLVEAVIAVEAEAITARAVVPSSGPFVSGDADPASYVIIEMMAQTIGAWKGWQRLQRDEEPQIGYLLGTRRFHCERATLVRGTSLIIEARLLFSDGELASFACTAGEFGEAPFAEANLNVFSPAGPEARA